MKKKNPWIRTAVAFAFALVFFILTQIAPGHEALVEKIYSKGIYKLWAQMVSGVTGLIPVSLTELGLLVGIPLLLVISIVRWVRHKIGWQRFASGWLTLALILYSLFSGGWALNYSRQTYAQTAGLETKPVEIEKVKALVVSLAQKANDLRAELDTGDEAIALPGTQRQVMRLVKEAYLRAGEKYPWLAGRYGAPKIAILSTPLAYLNIAGIFSPFTVEAHVNAHEGDVLLAATAAHEAAHLRGFAREDEANFIAYQVCMESEEVYVRYSGTMVALIYAGNALAKQNMEMYSEIYATYSEGVRADLTAYRKSWEPYKGEAAEIHNKVNDAYLKANNQADGVQSYGRMVDLLIAEYEKEKSAAAE